MTRKLCAAGVIGPYSYVLLDISDVVVAHLQDEGKDTVTTHCNMDVAEKWLDHQLNTLIGKRYETD